MSRRGLQNMYNEPLVVARDEVVLLVRTIIRKERHILVVALVVIGQLIHTIAPIRHWDLERLHLLESNFRRFWKRNQNH